MDELRLRLDESNDVGWGWLELDIPQVKMPFVKQSSGRCPIFVCGRALNDLTRLCKLESYRNIHTTTMSFG